MIIIIKLFSKIIPQNKLVKHTSTLEISSMQQFQLRTRHPTLTAIET